MIHVWAVKKVHEAHRPPNPEVNDTVAYAAKWLMDDGVVLEPLVGNRPWLSMEVMEWVMRQAWGPTAVNEDKKEEEGAFRSEQLLWGLFMDFCLNLIRLPEPKCVKAQYLLAEAALAPGCRRVTLKLAQELAGSANYWATAQGAIRPVLGALNRMLTQEDRASPWVNPKGTPEQKQAAWEDWDRGLELLRVMFETPEKWSKQLLLLVDRDALPQGAARAARAGAEDKVDRG